MGDLEPSDILIGGSLISGLAVLIFGGAIWLISIGVPFWVPIGATLLLIGVIGAAIKSS